MPIDFGKTEKMGNDTAVISGEFVSLVIMETLHRNGQDKGVYPFSKILRSRRCLDIQVRMGRFWAAKNGCVFLLLVLKVAP